MNEKNKLPVFGIGPFYVIIIILISFILYILNYHNFFEKFTIKSFSFIYRFIGVIFIIEGIIIWILAVVFSKIDKQVKNDKLVTSGIYRFVRNPIYSAFLYVNSGFLFLNNNYFLLFFPIVYYIFLTVLMIKTEEKWLENKFGEEYLKYYNKTNRCILFFSKKKG